MKQPSRLGAVVATLCAVACAVAGARSAEATSYAEDHIRETQAWAETSEGRAWWTQRDITRLSTYDEGAAGNGVAPLFVSVGYHDHEEATGADAVVARIGGEFALFAGRHTIGYEIASLRAEGRMSTAIDGRTTFDGGTIAIGSSLGRPWSARVWERPPTFFPYVEFAYDMPAGRERQRAGYRYDSRLDLRLLLALPGVRFGWQGARLFGGDDQGWAMRGFVDVVVGFATEPAMYSDGAKRLRSTWMFAVGGEIDSRLGERHPSDRYRATVRAEIAHGSGIYVRGDYRFSGTLGATAQISVGFRLIAESYGPFEYHIP